MLRTLLKGTSLVLGVIAIVALLGACDQFVGPPGPAGQQGPAGDRGPQGEQGERGRTGETGRRWEPRVIDLETPPDHTHYHSDYGEPRTSPVPEGGGMLWYTFGGRHIPYGPHTVLLGRDWNLEYPGFYENGEEWRALPYMTWYHGHIVMVTYTINAGNRLALSIRSTSLRGAQSEAKLIGDATFIRVIVLHTDTDD